MYICINKPPRLRIATTIAVTTESEVAVAEDGRNHDKGDDVLKASVVAEEASIAVAHHTHERGGIDATVLQECRQHGGKAVTSTESSRFREAENFGAIF